LHDELRPGRPRTIIKERVAQLVRKSLETKPKDTQPARQRGGSVRRRKKSDPSVETHATDPAFGIGLRRWGDARLSPPRHHNLICGLEHGPRKNDHAMSAITAIPSISASLAIMAILAISLGPHPAFFNSCYKQKYLRQSTQG
jgi:hypothetical protein